MKKPYKTQKEIVTDKVNEAKALLEAENKRITELCAKEINEALEPILKKHDCNLIITGQFQGNEIKTGFNIVKK